MAQLQLGKTLTDSQANDIVAFLNSLTGQIPEEALKVPILPMSE
jgi:cytochrome c peroxidase